MIVIPNPSLVLLIGPAGSGKSTFARKHFLDTQIVSSDRFRAMVSDDENNQHVSAAAFELLHLTAEKRLQYGRLTVVDATNMQAESRKHCLEIARRNHLPAIGIVFNLDETTCLNQNHTRERQVPEYAIKKHVTTLETLLKQVQHEGFRQLHVFNHPQEARAALVQLQRPPSWKREITGPFDIIGDVHGCLPELLELLTQMGYQISEATDRDGRPVWDVVPPGRLLIFVGDLVDRGPDTPGVLRLVRRMIEQGRAFCVRGNHDDKLARKLGGRDVNISSGLAESLEQIALEPPTFAAEMATFLENLPLHLVLDHGKLVVAHAGLKSELHGRDSDRVRAFCLFGDTTGEYDEFGLPIRLNWGANYHGHATVVYGHVPTYQPQWQNKTLCIDTGCVFGGWLTALRYPENQMVSIRSRGKWADPKKPFMPADLLLPPVSANVES